MKIHVRTKKRESEKLWNFSQRHFGDVISSLNLPVGADSEVLIATVQDPRTQQGGHPTQENTDHPKHQLLGGAHAGCKL